jgi:hypothetical protein
MIKNSILSILLLLLLLSVQNAIASDLEKKTSNKDFTVELPKIIIGDIPSEITLHLIDESHLKKDSVLVKVNGSDVWVKPELNQLKIPFVFKGNDTFMVSISQQTQKIN